MYQGFLISAFGKTEEQKKRFNSVKKFLKSFLRELKITATRADDIGKNQIWFSSIFSPIINSDVVFVDLSDQNQNALFECGVREALVGKSILLILDEQFKAHYPTDLQLLDKRVIKYRTENDQIVETKALKSSLRKMVREIIEDGERGKLQEDLKRLSCDFMQYKDDLKGMRNLLEESSKDPVRRVATAVFFSDAQSRFDKLIRDGAPLFVKEYENLLLTFMETATPKTEEKQCEYWGVSYAIPTQDVSKSYFQNISRILSKHRGVNYNNRRVLCHPDIYAFIKRNPNDFRDFWRLNRKASFTLYVLKPGEITRYSPPNECDDFMLYNKRFVFGGKFRWQSDDPSSELIAVEKARYIFELNEVQKYLSYLNKLFGRNYSVRLSNQEDFRKFLRSL